MITIEAFTPKFILEKYINDQLHGHFKTTSLFADISGFTRLTDHLMHHGKDGAEILANAMKTILNPLIEIVYHYGGFITGFYGDAFNAVFPENLTLQAVQAALDIQQFVQHHLTFVSRFGHFKFEIRLGVAQGKAEWGIFVPKRFPTNHQYYISGEAIEKSIHAQKKAPPGGVVLDQSVYSVVHSHITIETPENSLKNDKNIDRQIPVILLKDIPHAVNALQQDSDDNFDPKSAIVFMPPEIDFLVTGGEFRNILTMFIGLKGNSSYPKLNNFMQRLFQLNMDYGGLINKIDFTDKGQNFLLIWGAPRSYEDDIEKAANFILHLKKTSPIPFHAGITYRMMYTGLIGNQHRMEYVCYGRGIVLAVRQMMNAGWNKIWLDEPSAQRMGINYDITYVEQVSFKGFSEPQTVYELIGNIGLSSMKFYRTKLIDRIDELQQLRTFVQSVFNDVHAGLLVIYGEAGIGKSRLISEFHKYLNQVARNQFFWMFCPSNRILNRSLEPFQTCLKVFFDQNDFQSSSTNKHAFNRKYQWLIQHTDNEPLHKEVAQSKMFIADLLEINNRKPLFSKVDPKIKIIKQRNAIDTILKSLSLIHPLILEFDNLSAFDLESVELICYLLQSTAEYPIAMIASTRNEQSSAIKLIEAMFNQSLNSSMWNFQKMTLASLASKHLVDFAQSVLQAPVSENLLSLVAAKSDGNPLFIEQILFYLRQQQLIARQDNVYHLLVKEIDIPTEIRSLLIARLDTLPPDVRQTIQTASVLGNEIDLVILQEMLPDITDLESHLQMIENEGILQRRESKKYTFCHNYMRDAAYEMQLASQRERLHRSAAAALLNLSKSSSDYRYTHIAYHYEMANDPANTIQYLHMAARQAHEHHQNQMAAVFYQKLIALLPEDSLKITVSLEYGQILRLLGNWRELPDILERANELAYKRSNQHLAACQIAIGQYHQSRGQYHEAKTFFQTAHHSAKKHNQLSEQALALKQIGNIFLIQAEYETAQEYYDQAKEIFILLNDYKGISSILNNLGIIHYRMNKLEVAQYYYQQDYKLCEKHNDLEGLASVLGNIGALYEKMEMINESIKFFIQQYLLKKKLGDLHGICIALGNIGSYYNKSGNYRKALYYFTKELKIAEELGEPHNICSAYLNIANIHGNDMEYDLAIEKYQGAMEISAGLNEKRMHSVALGNLAILYIETNQLPKARGLIRKHLKIKRELKDTSGLAAAYSNISHYLAQGNKYRQALRFIDKAIALISPLHLKSSMAEYTLHKTDLLIRLNYLPQADELIKQTQACISGEHRDNYNFTLQLRQAELLIKKGQLEIAREHLLTMLSQFSTERTRADIYYLIWQVSRQKADRKIALQFNRKLYKKSKCLVYQQRVIEITGQPK